MMINEFFSTKSSFMKIVIRINSLLSVIAVLVYCCSCTAQGILPTTWKPGTILTITYSGGMMPQSDTTLISADGSYHSTYFMQKDSIEKRNYHLTQADLDGLMKVLKENRFEQIRTKQRNGIVYDMGTTTITLSWEGKSHSVSIGATEEVMKSQSGRLSNITGFVYELLKKH